VKRGELRGEASCFNRGESVEDARERDEDRAEVDMDFLIRTEFAARAERALISWHSIQCSRADSTSTSFHAVVHASSNARDKNLGSLLKRLDRAEEDGDDNDDDG